ncbi:MAG: hypothetical protein CVV44_00510 [Spirochaetae bacterium HGW-Spirochaetae-1]|jgi:hypothetical protein|nr:MAG: hypothetical protein CVV44_00510 [Spirochaetae bacterium HGW-Spirochaetae-1]
MDEMEEKNNRPPLPDDRRNKILKQVLKTLFIRIPLALGIIIALTLLFLKIYLTPGRVQSLMTDTFNKSSHGTLTVAVREFSPYSGFVMEDLVIKNGTEFDRSTFVSIKKLVFKYSFFRLFTGSVRFPEIGIYEPKIYLVEKKGRWNTDVLMKAGDKKPEKKTSAKKDTGGPLAKEISFPISLDFLLHFILKDMDVHVRGSGFDASMKGLTFTADMRVPPFKRLPLSLEALRLLETMEMSLNPREELDVSFYSRDAEVSPPLIVMWKLNFANGKGQPPRFNSQLKLGTYRTPVRFKQSHLAPLNFLVSYNIYYNPLNDYLAINNLSITFKSRRWIYLGGEIRNVTKNALLDLQMSESTILIDELYPYYAIITGDRKTRFGGSISFMPLKISGTASALTLDGSVVLKNFYARVPSPSADVSIPYMNLSYTARKRGDDVDLNTSLKVPHLFYTYQGGKSGDNGLDLTAEMSVTESFRAVLIKGISFRFFEPASGRSALSFRTRGRAFLGDTLKAVLHVEDITFSRDPLLSMTPDRYHKKISSIPLKNPVTMNIDLDFSQSREAMAADLQMLAKIPDYDLMDLRLSAQVVQDQVRKKIIIKNVALGSKTWNSSFQARGFLEMQKAPFSDSDIHLTMKFDSPEKRNIYDDWFVSGMMDLSTRITGDLDSGNAAGLLKIDNFNASSAKKKTEVRGFNLDFPFRYAFAARKQSESLLSVGKDQLIDNDNFREKPNFTISSIKGKHPARNVTFEYMKDFQAFMAFRNNIFEISNMKAYVMDGSLQARSILFNMADMKPANMEYKLIVDLTNVDIGKLDEWRTGKKARDAELSLTANFTGRNVNIKKQLDARGYINIYKIGKEFAGKLMKGLSEEKGKSKLGNLTQAVVDNTVKVKGFNFSLDKGNVYTTVKISQGFFRPIIKIDKDEITFDRMPIQEYLRRVREGE